MIIVSVRVLNAGESLDYSMRGYRLAFMEQRTQRHKERPTLDSEPCVIKLMSKARLISADSRAAGSACPAVTHPALLTRNSFTFPITGRSCKVKLSDSQGYQTTGSWLSNK